MALSVVIMSRYEVLEKLGTGRSSEIYLVRDKETGVYLVCKKFHYHEYGSAEMNLLRQELLTNKMLVHPNILRYQYVLDDKDSSCYYLVMEYFSQANLGYQLVKRKEAGAHFKESTIWIILAQLYDALAYIHSTDKIQSTDISSALLRDFRPTNFFLNQRGIIQIKSLRYLKLLDFGSVEAEPIQAVPAKVLLPYLAPEALMGNYYGVSADVWSLGCLLYEICTFKALAHGHTPEEILSCLSRIRAPLLLDHYSKDLSQLLGHMLQPDPKNRITMEQLGKHPLLFQAWEKYKKYITHTRRPIGDSIPLTPLCGCGGDGYGCCLAARRKNGLPDTYVARKDFKSTTLNPTNLWQNETFNRLTKTTKQDNSAFEVRYLNQDIENKEIKYQQIMLEDAAVENPTGHTPNATGLIYTQPALQTTIKSGTQSDFTLKQPAESYFATHGRYPKTVFNRLVYSNENSRLVEECPLQTQFEMVHKVTEDQGEYGMVYGGNYSQINGPNHTTLNTTMGRPGNMTMLGGFMGAINVDEIFRDDDVETQDRACSPIVLSAYSPNYTKTELYSLETNDGVTRHTKKHRNEFGDTISSCWQPSVRSNTSSIKTLNLNEKVSSLNMPSTFNYRTTDSSYNMCHSVNSNTSGHGPLYAASVSPPKRSHLSTHVGSNIQPGDVAFPTSYKASFYDPKIQSPLQRSASNFGTDKCIRSSVFEQFSSDEEEHYNKSANELINYRRSNPGSIYEEPLRLEYHKYPAQVPVIYNSGPNVSYLDLMKKELATTRAVGPNKPEKVKKQKKPKPVKKKGSPSLVEDVSVARIYTPDRSIMESPTVDVTDPDDGSRSHLSPSNNQQSTSYVPCTYEHYHAAHIPRARFEASNTSQVPLPGHYTHFKFTEAGTGKQVSNDVDIIPPSTKDIRTCRDGTDTHFLPHEVFVDKSALQKTHPINFSVENSSAKYVTASRGTLRGEMKKTIATDRGVGANESYE